MQRLSCPQPRSLVEAHCTCMGPTDLLVSIACCCFSHLTFCSLYGSISYLCSVFCFLLGGFTWLDAGGYSYAH